MVLSVCTCWSHSMVTLPPQLLSTDFGVCSYQCSVPNYTAVSLHTRTCMLKCGCALTLSCFFIYFFFASIGHADMMWSIVSSNWWQSLCHCVQHFRCKVLRFNAWSVTANISLSVSAFWFTFISHWNVFCSVISFHIYSVCIAYAYPCLFTSSLTHLQSLPLCVVYHYYVRQLDNKNWTVFQCNWECVAYRRD
jgi:hypothetical protein